MKKDSEDIRREIERMRWVDSQSIKKKSTVYLKNNQEEKDEAMVFCDVFCDFDLQEILEQKIFSRN